MGHEIQWPFHSKLKGRKSGPLPQALSFKLEFPCSNNIAEYEAYLTRLATAFEMGIKHLNVIGDSNLVICQAKGSFLLKEPSLAPYKTLAQKMEERFSTFEIEHA